MRKVFAFALLVAAAIGLAAYAATHRHDEQAHVVTIQTRLVNQKLCTSAAARKRAFVQFRAELHRQIRFTQRRYPRTSQAWSNLMTNAHRGLRQLKMPSYRTRYRAFWCSIASQPRVPVPSASG